MRADLPRELSSAFIFRASIVEGSGILHIARGRPSRDIQFRSCRRGAPYFEIYSNRADELFRCPPREYFFSPFPAIYIGNGCGLRGLFMKGWHANTVIDPSRYERVVQYHQTDLQQRFIRYRVARRVARAAAFLPMKKSIYPG
jgi:hypothetical protein